MKLSSRILRSTTQPVLYNVFCASARPQWLRHLQDACTVDGIVLYLEVGRYDDFAGWYLEYNGLPLKKPEVPLGVVGQQRPGQQLHQQRVQARFPAGQFHLHGTVPLGKGLQHRPAGKQMTMEVTRIPAEQFSSTAGILYITQIAKKKHRAKKHKLTHVCHMFNCAN